MNKIPKLTAYGKLCSMFYDATKKFATERELDFYSSFMKKDESKVLEAMCGSGRLLIPLIQRGYHVDGVDNSSSMLENCRQRCAQTNSATNLYEQSLENLNVPHKYTTVTIAVASFQLITDRNLALQALQKLHMHMHKHGDLLLDIFVPEIDEEPSIRLVTLDERNKIRLTIRYVFDLEKKQADAFCLYELLVDGIVQEQENELLQLVWYSDDELKHLLEKAGFEVVAFHKDLWLRDSGPSCIVHARAL